MKLFVLKMKYRDKGYFEKYYEKIREDYYTKWDCAMLFKEATFRIVK